MYTRDLPQANMAYQGSPSEDNSSTHTWFPNIGATNHATPDLASLSAYTEYNGGDTLRVGDGMRLPISHIGHASFNTPSRSFRLSNVLHAPKLSNSLLYV